MRSIKFRGFDSTGQKGWVYGDLGHNQKVTKTGLEPRTMVGGYEVFPESVCQFTGMKDRKGNEIYEGDIVICRRYLFAENKRTHLQTCIVDFVGGSFVVTNKDDKTSTCLFNAHVTRIVGNIYELNNK